MLQHSLPDPWCS